MRRESVPPRQLTFRKLLPALRPGWWKGNRYKHKMKINSKETNIRITWENSAAIEIIFLWRDLFGEKKKSIWNPDFVFETDFWKLLH